MPEASSPPASPVPPSSAPVPPVPPSSVPASPVPGSPVPASPVPGTVPAGTAPVSFGWEHRVGADLGVVRSQLQRELREQRFTLMGDTVTTIEATRGSQLAAFVLQHDNLPMTAHIRLNPVEGGCVVSLQLQETGKVPSRFLGVRNAYQRAFADLRGQLDEALVQVDPDLHLEPVQAVPGEPEGFGDQLGTAAGHFGRAVVQRANHLLEGKDTSKPTAWKDLDEVLFVSSKGQAELDVERVQAMLVVAGLVSSQPGAMPANLARDVEVWAARVESALDLSKGADSVRIELNDEQLPVLGFLSTQAAIRESVPLRTLHVCTTCRLERVTNPDYLRMAERHRKLLALTGGLGTTIGKKGVTPFVIVGQFLKIKKLDPDFVCSRCQSTTADEWVVTFCPKCGDRRQEAVLRTCPKCNYDFRKAVGAPELWHPAPPPAPALTPPVPPQVALPAGGASVAGPQAQAHAASGPGLTTSTLAPFSPQVALPPAGWYVDPYQRYAQRWWDGLVWSQYVNGNGGQALDPV